MSKRFFHSEFDKGNNSKRQKTENNDFKVPGTSKQFPVPSTSASSKPQPPKAPPKVINKPAVDDLWGDDNDDDLILVASQIEEVYSQQQVASQMNISQMNCSYGGFARKADVFSTQNSKPVAVQKFSYNVRKQMDDENDLDVIALMNDLENNVDKPGPSAMRPLQPSVQDRKHHLESNSQKENSKDAQIKHITKKLKMLEAVNGQLKKNNFELTNKYQTKEGEATNLRNEVRAIKQHYDQQKLLKIQENEHLKNSWVQEKRDFQKMGNTLKAELEMAKMDAITSRLNSTTAVVRRPVKKIITTKKLDISVGGSKNKLFESSGMAMDSRIFDNLVDEFHDTFSLSLKDRLKYNYLLKLQTTLAKMQVDYSEFGCFKDEMIDDLFASAGVFAKSLKKYLNLKKNIEGARNSFKFLSVNFGRFKNQCSGSSRSIYQKEPLFKNEKGIFVRRILAIYSIVCRYSLSFSEKISKELINYQNGEGRTFVQILVNCLNKLSFSNELYNFSGIVAASAGLLSSLAFNYSSQKDDEFLFLLFQSIVFCRPDNPLVLQTLSDFLLQISKNEMASGVINRLCCNSAVAAFVTNRKYKIIRFKNYSCVLQVYGALLESVYKGNEVIEDSEVGLLLDIAQNTIYFFRNCITSGKIEFLLPTRHNEVPRKCNCILKLIDALIGFLYLILKNSMYDRVQYRKRVISIVQTGVFALSNMFTVNSRNQVYYGHEKKNRLITVYDLLNAGKGLFEFQQVHHEAMRPLEMIRLRRAQPDKNIKTEKRIKNSFLYFSDKE